MRFSLLTSSTRLRCPLGSCRFPAGLISAPATVEFNRDIRPIFSDKCFTCHGPDKANRVTELRFDTEAGAKIALSEGRQSLVPGDPDKSELFRRIASNDEAVRMPPAAMGHAKLSDVGDRSHTELDSNRERNGKDTGHSSLRSGLNSHLLRTRSGPVTQLTRLVLHRLEREGLTPAAEADKATLIRRLSLGPYGLASDPVRKSMPF